MGDTQQEKKYACWLDSIRFLSSAGKYKLLDAAKTAENIYRMKESDLTFFIGAKGSMLITQAKKMQSPDMVYLLRRRGFPEAAEPYSRSAVWIVL